MISFMSEEGKGRATETITCGVTTWYYKRIGMIAVMLFLFGLYFMYDGKWGYPAENRWAELKQHLEKYEDAQKAGGTTLEDWMAKAKGYGLVKSGETPPTWQAYSAEHDAPLNPEPHGPEAITQQFQFGGAMLLASIFALGLLFVNRNKKLVGYADHMVMPNGVNVSYAEVTKVDKRKWPVKGLAYVYYRSGEGQGIKRVTMDDLKFDGTGLVMDRLLSTFKGELIEKPESPQGPVEPRPISSNDQPS